MSSSRFSKLAGVVLTACVCCLVFAVVAQAENAIKGATVINEIKHDVSLPLWQMAKLTPLPKNARKEIELRGQAHIKQMPGTDTNVQSMKAGPQVSTTDLLNFDGQGADGVAPPDTEGAVGATQYVQWVNLEYNVYNKSTGAKILGPVAGNAFWSGFGGPCQSNNAGDPIVLYDKVAQRWFVAQNVFNTPYTYCIAVSTSNDITGTFHRYSFAVAPTNFFPDYPKWGVWPDAYYSSVNVFLNGFSQDGVQACAADRNNMLAGNAATMQCFNTSSSFFSLLPSDQDGLTPPPAGSPNYYISLGSNTSSLNMWKFHVDFTNPSNSTFTGPTAITVPNYTLTCQNTRACVPQPSPGEGLDALGGRVMYRFAYRNFGTYESLLVSNTVKPGAGSSATTAVRWYEIRNPSSPTLFQSQTLQHPTYSIWMSSMAQDKNGDIALGLSASATTLKPSIGYLGRVPTDPPGTLEAPKTVVVGTGVQQSTANRWGDYSAMQIDPTDDCTFWFTEEYIKTSGSFNWSTRINSFKFTSCH